MRNGRTRYFCSLTAAFGTLLLAPHPSEACTLAPSMFAIGDVTPSSQGAAELNAPLVVTFDNQGIFPDSHQSSFLQPAFALRAKATGTLVELGEPRMVGGYLGSDTAYAVVPTAQLEPNTSYELSVETGQTPAPTIDGAISLTASFTTGAELRPPLSIDGELSVSFEAGTRPHMECNPSSTCDSGCVQKGVEEATLARLQIPPISGGFSEEFGYVSVMVTERVPYVEGSIPIEGEALQAFRYEAFEPNQAGELVMPLPERRDGGNYPPCFTLTVVDARGDRQTKSLCTEASGNEGNDLPAASSACAISGAGAGNRDWLALTALAAALSTLSRRRRQETAS
jgi:hypothetical protein